MIVKLQASPLKMKRYRVALQDGRTFDFGLKGGQTYIDHKDEKKREAYRKRHLGNATENKLINALVPSPSLFAYYLLWGPYPDLQKNINYLNGRWSR